VGRALTISHTPCSMPVTWPARAPAHDVSCRCARCWRQALCQRTCCSRAPDTRGAPTAACSQRGSCLATLHGEQGPSSWLQA
jgi:hypothetical protein